MPTDFARRPQAPKKKRKTAQPKRQSPTPKVLFHGPSFSSGAIVGAAIVVLAAYAPEILDDTVPTAAAGPTEERSQLVFEFDEILRETEVRADPQRYEPPESEREPPPEGYFLQAASFRTKPDADQLRALLLLRDLPAQTATSNGATGTWHRVIVGPFARKLHADRAMRLMREQNLHPMWLNAGN